MTVSQIERRYWELVSCRSWQEMGTGRGRGEQETGGGGGQCSP